MRAKDRHTANTILQIVLTAIPAHSGRVTQWLGPSYFNEVLPLIAGEQVRILRGSDPAKFRNAHNKTGLVRGTITVVGTEDVEVTVREKFGLRVMIRNSVGAEQVLECGQLRQCVANPHTNRDDPSTSLRYHAWNARQVTRIQDGTAIEYMCNKAWVKTRALRLIRGHNAKDMSYTLPKDRVIHCQSVQLSAKKIRWARKENKLWGSGRSAPISAVREREVISPATYSHLRDYIFSSDFLEPLKATEQATKRGHCYAMRERIATTLPRYRAEAKAKGIPPVSKEVYRRILSSKVFTNYRKDHCMCKTCLRSGWRGIWDKGRKLLKDMNAKPCWPLSTRSDGTQQVHGPQLHDRLKRLWDFLRLQHRLHFKEESTTAAHCLRLNLGSLADARLNEPCKHVHPDRTARPDMPRTETRTSAKCSDAECEKRPCAHCKHCRLSFCRKHLESNLCTSECIPPAKVMGDEFVCRGCQPLRDSYRHTTTGCATCDEVEFFKEDLLLCAHRTKCPDMLGRAKCVCESIDIMVGHTARLVNQERFWPLLMEEMRTLKRYDHVAVKSDYWKKFEGT